MKKCNANNNKGNSKVSRRTALKVGLSGLAVGSGLMGISGSVSADDQKSTSVDSNPGTSIPPVTIKHGKKLKQLDGSILPLVGEKDKTLEYIDAAKVPSSQKNQAREDVKVMWDRININEITKRRGKGSNKTETTVYKLQGSIKHANKVLRELREKDKTSRKVSTTDGTKASDVHSTINAGAKELSKEEADDKVSIQWKADDSHQIMNYFAGKNLDLDENKCMTLQYAGDDPDNWEYNVSGVPEAWEEAFQEPGRRYTHAHDPISQIGVAHRWAQDYMVNSQNADSQLSKYKNMGYALHFLADMGNPMHTGNFNEQITNQWVHHTYEISANDHLMFESDNESGVRNILLNNVNFDKHPQYGPNSYEEVKDPGQFQFWDKWAHHAVRLARKSHDYSTEHVQRTYNIGAYKDVLEKDTTLETQVEYLHAETMKFMMGFVEEYNSDVSY